MFRALCAHHHEVKILLYSIWYHHTEKKVSCLKLLKYKSINMRTWKKNLCMNFSGVITYYKHVYSK